MKYIFVLCIMCSIIGCSYSQKGNNKIIDKNVQANEAKESNEVNDSLADNEFNISSFLASFTEKNLTDTATVFHFVNDTSLLFISFSEPKDSIKVNIFKEYDIGGKGVSRILIEQNNVIYFDYNLMCYEDYYVLFDSCADRFQKKILFDRYNKRNIGLNISDDSLACLIEGIYIDYLFSYNIGGKDSVHLVMLQPKELTFSNINKSFGNFCSMLYFNRNGAIIAFNLSMNSVSKIYLRH